MIKPLDFVRINDHVGIVEEITEFISQKEETIYSASVIWIGKTLNKGAWFQEKELEIIDNLPNLLSRGLRHPFSSEKKYEDELYPINKI